MTGRFVFLLALTTAAAFPAQADPDGCNAPAAAPSVTISLPAAPFAVAPAHDGCWVFVSLTGIGPGIAVLKRASGKIELVRTVPLASAPTGITLTHDGKLLIAAAGNNTIFVDVGQMTGGGANPVLGSFSDGRPAGSIYANVTPDDKLLFVSEESAGEITVIDLERARKQGYTPEAIIGKIPTGLAPIALTFSPDGKWLYTTSEVARPDWNWPKVCKPEAPGVPDTIITNPEGAVVVVDVARAHADPAHSVAARVPAGCSAVRMAIAPDGARIYVTARNNNALLAFDTAKLVPDSAHALAAIAPLGDAPVPVAVIDGGKKVIAGNSNRFAGGDSAESLVVLDAARIAEGMGAVLGIVPAGAFPREMAVSADGRTLFLTNFGSKSLQVMDIAHLPIDRNLPPEIAANASALAHRNERKEITVDPQVLNHYTGVYLAQDGRALIIGLQTGQLTARIDVQPALRLLPASQTLFFLRPGMLLEFSNAAGQQNAGQLILHQNEKEIAARRLDEAAAKPYLDAAAAFDKRFQDQTPAQGSEAAARKLIAGLQAGKPDESIMTPGGMTREALQTLQSQASQIGAIDSIAFRAVGPAGPDIYAIKSANGSWDLRVWLTPEGKIEQAVLTRLGTN